ncbi:MAG: segregation/condensation protein A [Christensenellaceae bacterium]|jgi:segregation and condensation protein A|nr:segregation/condensation protein A [Christensenellaceae bacterium]
MPETDLSQELKRRILETKEREASEVSIDDDDFNDDDALPDVSALSYHYYEEVIPYDKIYEYCKDNKLKITEIQIADVIQQFNDYIATLPSKDYNTIANFIKCGSQLLRYKSAELVFFSDNSQMDDYEENVETTTSHGKIFYADEYAMFREVSEQLALRERLNRFYRRPVYRRRDYKPILKNADVDKFVESFEEFLETVEYPEEITEVKVIERERFTETDMIKRIILLIREKKIISLFDLFEPDFSKLEVINSFLAVLEVLKRHVAISVQEKRGSNIILKHTPETDEVDLDNTESFADVEYKYKESVTDVE